MTAVPLRLRRDTRAVRPATAWLVRGDSPAEWLEEITRWPVSLASLRCLILPRSDRSGSADAVLVLLAEPLPDDAHPPHALPFGRAVSRLLVPVEAVIEPALTTEEWASLLTGIETLFVWRAHGDLVAFEPQDVLTVADLLTARVETARDWTAARDVPAFVGRLRSIASSMPLPVLDDMESDWQRDVGEPGAVRELPPAPEEPAYHWTERLAQSTAGMRRAWRRTSERWSRLKDYQRWLLLTVGFTLIGLILLLVFGAGGSGAGISWPEIVACLLIAAILATLILSSRRIDRSRPAAPTSTAAARTTGTLVPTRSLWSWMRGGFQTVTIRRHATSPLQEADRRQRDREVQRLLHMLDQNPEDGLRYAIPFGGDAARGVAAPGNQLVARDLNFTAGARGGQAADYWEISPEQQRELLNRYRTLAESEQRRGRHRRAAYVYSQLLGDWRAAATVLIAGHHYADAAVIYDKRLGNVAEAARCYELAGHVETALELHIKSANWLAAGDLCVRTERTDEARQHYRSGVATALSTGDVQRAATILEDKLHEVDEALDVLAAAWPADRRANACLDAWFNLTARHHRTEAAQNRIRTLSAETTPEAAGQLLPRLQHVHQKYPDAEVQHRAAEATLHVVARHLPNANPATAQQLTAFLPALVPNDRLLARDCQRYVDDSRSQAVKPAKILRKSANTLWLQNQLRLTSVPIGTPFLTSTEGWVLLTEQNSEEPQELMLISWSSSGRTTQLARGPQPANLVAVDNEQRKIWLKSSNAAFRMDWPPEGEPWDVISPEFLPTGTVLALPRAGMTRVLWFDDHGGAWLSLYTGYGKTVRSIRIAEEWLGDPQHVVPALRGRATMQSMGSEETLTFLPVGDGVILGECHSHDGIRTWAKLLAAEDVICSPEGESRRVLLRQTDAVILVDDVTRSDAGQLLLTGWHEPRTTFLSRELSRDLLVVVDDRRIALFRSTDRTPIAEQLHDAAPAIAVVPFGIANCSVLRSDGTVEFWLW